MTTDARPTGLDMKLERVAARVKVRDLALLMGITPSRVSRIEGQTSRLTPDMERRYRAALDLCRTSGTSQAA